MRYRQREYGVSGTRRAAGKAKMPSGTDRLSEESAKGASARCGRDLHFRWRKTSAVRGEPQSPGNWRPIERGNDNKGSDNTGGTTTNGAARLISSSGATQCRYVVRTGGAQRLAPAAPGRASTSPPRPKRSWGVKVDEAGARGPSGQDLDHAQRAGRAVEQRTHIDVGRIAPARVDVRVDLR